MRVRVSLFEGLFISFTLVVSLALLSAPLTFLPTYRRLLQELGGGIPRVTALALSSWFLPCLGGMVLALVVLRLLRPFSDSARRWLLLVGVFSALGALGFLIWAFCAPVLEMAGQIRAP